MFITGLKGTLCLSTAKIICISFLIVAPIITILDLDFLVKLSQNSLIQTDMFSTNLNLVNEHFHNLLWTHIEKLI